MSTSKEAHLAPSPAFRKQATRSLLAIISFILVYFVLLGLSLLLVALCFYGGVRIMMLGASLLSLIVGLGIIACGIMVFIFLVKFLFASHKEDRSDSMEITEEEQPELFRAIYELAAETGTSRPKHIYLSADVNACVFYDSSFWSMFLPIRKNLKIGLGLVNIVNTSELKAVIAHEFGHFSQRSMKLGSWVYAVNRIIHDMLYNNTSYSRGLGTMASIHGVVAFFVQVTVKIVQGIIWVLHQMFRVVNKAYLGLSREMEFHADLVAASVCGSNNIISALRRSEFGEVCYGSTVDTCNKAWQEKKVVTDFYAHHRTVVRHLAPVNGLKLVHDLPLIQVEDKGLSRNRVNYLNQWSSHPTLRDRQAHLAPFGLDASVEEASAWSLFRNGEVLREELTRKIYHAVPQEEVKGTMDAGEFEALFTRGLRANMYPEAFGAFYGDRQVSEFDPQAMAQTPFALQPFESILSREDKSLPMRLRSLEADIAVLQAIADRKLEVTSFDFNGQKYPRSQAKHVLAQLEGEKAEVQNRLEELDARVFRHFYAIGSLEEAEALKSDWIAYFRFRKESEAFFEKTNHMMETLSPIYGAESLAIQDIQQKIAGLKAHNEPAFKEDLKQWIEYGAFENNSILKGRVEKFLESDCAYFSGTGFYENELWELSGLAQDSWNCINGFVRGLFHAITMREAAMLEQQASGEEKQSVGEMSRPEAAG